MKTKQCQSNFFVSGISYIISNNVIAYLLLKYIIPQSSELARTRQKCLDNQRVRIIMTTYILTYAFMQVLRQSVQIIEVVG